MGTKKRSAALVVFAGILGVAVLADKLGLFSSQDGSDTDTSSRYIQEAALAEQSRLVVAQENEWAETLQMAQEAWSDARGRMVEAPSAEVAGLRLRNMVEQAAAALGLSLDASNLLPESTPIEGEPIRLVGLSLSLHADNSDMVYRLIDALENLPDAATNISRLNINGPGALRVGTGLGVQIDLRALAIIGQGGAA